MSEELSLVRLQREAAASNGGYRMCQGQDGTWYAVFKTHAAMRAYYANNRHFDDCDVARFNHNRNEFNAFVIGSLH